MPVETIISDKSLTESGFYWRERDGVVILVCRPLEDAGFINGFSTRLGGVSPFPADSLNLAGFNEDTAENIYENRRRFFEALGTDHRLAAVWQVHGDGVKVIAEERDVRDLDEKFDALCSDLPQVVCGIKTADCVPVLFADPRTGAFAAAHAGWRGTVLSIAVRTIETMHETFKTDPRDLICAIGPAACREYEVGSDVIDGFAANFPDADKYFTPTRAGHAFVDLHLANRDQLMSAGVPASNIFTAPLCTLQRTDLFFSYRREKAAFGKTGRLLSVIGRAI